MFTDFGMWNDEATAVAVQRDGKIVVAGVARLADLELDFGLVRYNSDGSLDSTFGVGGISVTDFGDVEQPVGLAIQPDDKIVVAGNGNNGLILARYEPDGTLDSTFLGGAATAGLDGGHRAEDLVLQQDGRIVVAGSFAAEGADSFHEFLVLRFRTDGTLDPTFGSGGRVTTAWTGEGGAAGAVAVQADGRIVVAGSQFPAFVDCQPYDPCDSAFALIRYNSDGSIDPSFGGGGMVTTGRPGETNTTWGMVLQPDGKIVVFGGRPTPATPPVVVSDFLIVRYHSDGTLDASFGVGGEATTNFGGYDEARAVALQPDGKIIAAGVGGSSDPVLDPLHGWIVPAEFAVARYHPDGTLDRSFGVGGKVLVDVGDTSGATALALQLDGNVVVADARRRPARKIRAVVRLMGATSATE